MDEKNKTDQEIFIVTGGILTEKIIPLINGHKDIIIGVDKGAQWLIDHKIIPDYFIGDFDSVTASFLESIKEKYPDRLMVSPDEKDETDTELALSLALSLKPKKITILGGIGSRLDHVIANIHLLLQSEKQNIQCAIIGTSNRIQVLLPEQSKKINKSDFRYISLIPFSEKVEGINLNGFKFPLKDAEMEIGHPFGISNELINFFGTISIKKGILLIIESKD